MERLRKRKLPSPIPSTSDQQELPSEDDLTCRICQKTFSRSDNLATHIRAVHGKNKIRCVTCHKTFSSEQKLSRHEETHSNEASHECALCSKIFSRADSLRYHESSAHREATEEEEGDDVFIARQCRHCLTENFEHHNLIWFMRDGKPKREHQCLICLKSSQFCLTLTGHHKEHNLDEIPRSKCHQCQQCFRLFGHKKSKKRHRCEVVPENKHYTLNAAQGRPTVSYVCSCATCSMKPYGMKS